MKLIKHTPEYIKYLHNDELIDIPRYKFSKDDVRGCWISNVVNIDTPKMTDIRSYQEYLISILDNMKSYNMNVAIFQVRPVNDAYYYSTLNPWSRYITGVEGKDPGFDVLEFFIKEAKKRMIRVHAWMNPYRCGCDDITKKGLTKEEYLDTLASNNFARMHKEHTILDGTNKVILAPSHPEVIDFVTKSVLEVATNYDVEAVHIDDYFYPYAKIKQEDEWEDYLKYRISIDESFDDWRRSNVNKMIKSVHDGLKNLFVKSGKKVLFGISPFAIYRTHSSLKEDGFIDGSYHSPKALECYSDLYSDVLKWMEEGWIDYVVPQNYFSFDRSDVSYHNIAWWWDKMCTKTNTTLYMGQGLYHAGESSGFGFETWQNKKEIENQLRFNCNFTSVKGVIFFTYHDLIEGKNKIKDYALKSIKNLWNPHE